MNKTEKILVFGDDKRQFYLYKILKENNYNVDYKKSITGDILKNYHVFILPIPFSRDGKNICGISIDSFIELIPRECEIIGGALNNLISLCKDKNPSIVDLTKNEAFSSKNAIATAEGSIAYAIASHPINIQDSEILVAGYGKCGEPLARKLKNLGGRVTVLARNSNSLYLANAMGLNSMDLRQFTNADADMSIFKKFDFIFNTIPSLIFNKNILSHTKQDVFILDIASKPGGVDSNYCKQCKINYTLLGGIPSIYSPKTSAQIIFSCIERR